MHKNICFPVTRRQWWQNKYGDRTRLVQSFGIRNPAPPLSVQLWWLFELTLYRHLCSYPSSIKSASWKELHSTHYCLSAIFHASWFSVTKRQHRLPQKSVDQCRPAQTPPDCESGYNQGKSLALVMLIEWLFSMLYLNTDSVKRSWINKQHAAKYSWEIRSS